MKISLLTLIILLILPQISFTFSANNSMIIDLNATDLSEFLTEASSWTLSDAVCPSCNQTFTTPSTCSGIPREIVYGGPNILGPTDQNTNSQYYRRVYPGMTEDPISYGSEIPLLRLNDVNFVLKGTSSYSICNSNYQVSTGVTVNHIYKYSVYGWFQVNGGSGSSSSLKFDVISQASESSKEYSFGIKNLRIYNMNSQPSATVATFPCDSNSPWTGTACLQCHQNCETCYGPTENECTVCRDGYLNYNNGTCLSTCTAPFKYQYSGSKWHCVPICPDSYFWASNSSCSPTCDPPFKFSIDSNNLTICSNPCSGTSQFLYPNGSCIADCTTPLTPQYSPQQICTNPCNTEDLYLYRNRSCLSTCPSPLLVRSIPSITYCYNPCLTSQYLYANSSCSSSCDPPLVTETWPRVTFCRNPCQPSEYLYPNGSCIATCASPLRIRSTPDTNFCYSPCTTPAQFLYPNSSCLYGCASPLVSQTESVAKYCRNPCQPSEYLYPNGSCFSTCAPPLFIRSIPDVNFCYNPCSSSLQFLYPNSSCLVSCNSPLITQTESVAKFCRNPCQSSGYLFLNGSCKATCPQPLLIRTTPDVQYCYSPCSTAQPYLYLNGSCYSSCETPLVTQIESAAQFCRNPCQPSEYLYLNGSCFATCPQPLHIRNTPDTNYCYNPCDISTQFLSDDGSCTTSCDPPLVISHEPQVRYCRNPCYGTNNYIYPNHSCIASCPSPLFSRLEYPFNFKYCENPCSQNTTFLDHNQTCQSLCPSPLVIRKESIANFCLLPCENPDDYFFEPTGKCQKTCDSPYTAIDSPVPKLCISTLSEEEVKQVKQMAAATSTAGTAASTGVMVFSLVSSSDSTAVCMGPIAKMLQYIKFMNIHYPEKVELMLEQQSENANSGGFTGKMMGGVLEKFPNHELPRRFTVYKMHSSFFVNYWPTLFNLLVIFFVTFTVIILSWQTKNSPRINGILQTLLEILKWNVVLITFCGSLGDVMLYTALEFQTMQFDNFEAVLSFLLCSTINFLAIFVVVKILEVNLIIRKSKKNNAFSDDQIEKQWCSYKALFECYRDSSYYQQIFLFVFIIRLALFNGIIGYLYNYPLFQAVIFMLCNVLMLIYLVMKRPMRKLISLIQQIILELVLLPFNACVLALAIMDKHGIEAVDQRKSIGNVIFYINLAVPFLSLVLMVVKFIAIGIEFYQQRKAAKLQKLKKFNIEFSRNTNTTLNTTQDILPTQTLSSPTFNNKTAENIQVLDMVDNSFFTRSPDNSFNRLNSRMSPNLPRNRRPRFHHPELILPDVPQEQSRAVLNENSGFQERENELSIVQNEPPIVQNEKSKILV